MPATRVDLSGFGESLNSNWYDLAEPAPATQRVDMNVYVGRAERVVIQVSANVETHAGRTRPEFSTAIVRDLPLWRQSDTRRHDAKTEYWTCESHQRADARL